MRKLIWFLFLVFFVLAALSSVIRGGPPRQELFVMIFCFAFCVDKMLFGKE